MELIESVFLQRQQATDDSRQFRIFRGRTIYYGLCNNDYLGNGRIIYVSSMMHKMLSSLSQKESKDFTQE